MDVAGVKTILDNIKTNNVEDYVTINKRALSALYSYLLRLDDITPISLNDHVSSFEDIKDK